MLYCSVCVMPETRPGTIILDKNTNPSLKVTDHPICLACHNHGKRDNINWEAKWFELEYRVKIFKRQEGWDCVLPISGGKDSYYMVDLVKNKLGMNPLLVRVGDGFTNTAAGRHNLKNMTDVFECDLIQYDINVSDFRCLTRDCFTEYGNFPFIDCTVYTIPIYVAHKMGIPLVIYGEDPNFEYGTANEADEDADKHIIYNARTMQYILDRFQYYSMPATDVEHLLPDMDVFFLGYYVPWSSAAHYEIAKQFGFRDISTEGGRQGYIDNYEQIDMIGWQVSNWLKYLKYGFGRTTDMASKWIRDGLITRQEAVSLVLRNDHLLDQKILDDFLDLTGYTVREFYTIAEKHRNQDLFTYENGVWKRKYTP